MYMIWFGIGTGDKNRSVRAWCFSDSVWRRGARPLIRPFHAVLQSIIDVRWKGRSHKIKKCYDQGVTANARSYFSPVKKHLPPQLSFFMLCVGKNLAPPIYWLGEISGPFRVPIFRPANPLLFFRYFIKFFQGTICLVPWKGSVCGPCEWGRHFGEGGTEPP